MKRIVLCLAAVCACLTAEASARAQILLAADEKAHVAEVELAKVMAEDSSLWLSVRLEGRARLALVTAAASVETTKSSQAWLRGLDRATRVQVSPPPGPLASCTNQLTFPAADSGLPEPATLPAQPVTRADSELELRRSLENAGISVDLSQLDAFSAEVAAPFQISWFDAGAEGGDTAAVRLIDHGHQSLLPDIRVAGLDAIATTFIALAGGSVLPDHAETADTSELMVTYFAASASSDYARVRSSFLLETPDRWLAETAGLAIVPDAKAGGADGQVAIDELGGQALRATRWLGSVSPGAPPSFHVAPAAREEPNVSATDFDTSECSPASIAAPTSGTPGRAAPVDPPAMAPGRTAVVVDTSGDPTYVSAADASCNTTVVGSSSDDSCSGDPSSSDPPPSDSCSGDSSTSNASSGDSCSGDSESSKKDPSGCGSSDSNGYDGDTCSGDTSRSAPQQTSTALESANEPGHAPRRLRLSLLTLLAAGLSLPLRRRVK